MNLYFSLPSEPREDATKIMDATYQLQIQKPRKRRLTEDQLRILDRNFTLNKKIDREHKFKLAKELGVPPVQVAIWYQNKRARTKTQSLELEYKELEEKLGHALAEKRRLEQDNERLQEELNKAKNQVFVVLNQNMPPPPDVLFVRNSAFCNIQGGGSSLQCYGLNEDNLQLEELCAYMRNAESSRES